MLCISISHRLAAVEIRQSFAFTPEESISFIKGLMLPSVVLSTCNRVEIYCEGGLENLDYIENRLAEAKRIDKRDIKKYINIYADKGAILHLYNVACGLESAIVGEDEILGQLKNAYYTSMEHIETGTELNTLFKGAITCAKKVKTDTLISKTAVSIGTLAANLVFESKAENVLVIGATGYTGGIIIKNILHDKNIRITGTQRSHNASISYNADGVRMIDFAERYSAVNEADVIVSATKSPHYTITLNDLKNAINKDKKRIFIDVAVPRDIDKDILQLNNTVLYDIDYFKTVMDKNSKLKLREIDRAGLIIDEMVDEVEKELYFHTLLPKLNSLANVIESSGPRRLIYAVRDELTCDEFKRFVSAIEKIK
jgi:glutamyl-tRNA reductase